MNTDKRVVKPLCSKILPSGKQCGFPIYKDTVCERHHQDWQYYGKADAQEYDDEKKSELEYEIGKAIILLIELGYRIDKPK